MSGVDFGPGASLVWDNIGEGWRFNCRGCDHATLPSPRLSAVADEIVEHWADAHPEYVGETP